ncbi:hypothetical protein ERO13_A08G147400v2 [Gossypium hirsutum]|uniref:Uncharacterized protein n=1 Tax=Gossypium tomentosum TaxID=34277 RepID=A0A5D2PH71_GOSTO|nr:hypothetical protein ERO13_A08G147400v2 [Gossypium hirsutum]TYI15256.1 hypothetical protein ES332_A08G174300v1 [Gossypium tomentosum]
MRRRFRRYGVRWHRTEAVLAWLLETETYGGAEGARLRRKARGSPRVSGLVIFWAYRACIWVLGQDRWV